MTPDWALVACLIGGVGAGVLGAVARIRPHLDAGRQACDALRGQAETAALLEQQLADLRAQISMLRHDLRGILSPALLAADRLTSSEDPAIRKTGDIVIRTVERATARLAETRLGQEASKSL